MSINLINFKDSLAQLCVDFGVKRLELFGSASRQDFNEETSDLDFLIEFADSSINGAFDRYFGLKEALEHLFQRPVNLVDTKAINNPYFRRAIEQEKILIYRT